MSNKYDHKKIESKWRDIWEKAGLNRTDLKSVKPKHYNLVMFPYPSAEYIHLGHIYSYSGADVYGRYQRLKGKNVFEPIGFDSFGLPAENFAIKKGIHPEKVIDHAIDQSTRQLKEAGFMFDWFREVITSKPDYYKWTQLLFLKLYDQGLAYRKEAPVNWCPSCKTVLANEQVKDGLCDRCDTEVVQKEMKQWFFKVTDYAERLIKDLDKVDWPESSKIKQRNWIGRSEGVEMDMQITDSKEKFSVFTTRIDTVYGMTYVVLAPEHPLVNKITTDKQKKEVEKYKIQAQKQTEIERQSLEKDKTGVFTGSYAINPFTGEKVPIWIADYVLFGYGTGAVMAVPAHDERDFEFAKKYKLPIIQSIAPHSVDTKNPPRKGKTDTRRKVVHVILENDKGEVLTLNLKGQEWGDNKPKTLIIGGIEDRESPEEAAMREIEEETGYTDVQISEVYPIEFHAEFFAAHKDVNRYVETVGVFCQLKSEKKVPVSENEKKLHEIIWVKKKNLLSSVTIPDDIFLAKAYVEKIGSYTEYGVLINSGKFTGLIYEEAKKKMADWLEKKGIGSRKINYRLHDWSIGRQRYWGAPIPIIHCDKCGVVPVPEKDLPVKLPENIKDFRPKGTGKGPLASVSEFVNVKCPRCGGKAERETDTMDTFVDSSFYFLRYPSTGDDTQMMEPKVTKKWLPVDMYVGGAEHVTMHLLYARFITKALHDAKLITFDEPFMKLRHQGYILGPDGKKMSKSKGNVVNPDGVVKEHGADAFRTYILFMARFEDGGPWNPKGLVGVSRFLEKIWRIGIGLDSRLHGNDNKGNWPDVSSTEVQAKLARTIKKVGEDIESFKFNTAVASLMTLMNGISVEKRPDEDWISKGDFEKLLIILAPFAPFITEELWEKLGNKDSIHVEKWPAYDEKLIQEEAVTIAVQVNGKVRDQLVVNVDSAKDEVFELAKASEKVQKYLLDKEVKKVIYIEGKLLSLVVN